MTNLTELVAAALTRACGGPVTISSRRTAPGGSINRTEIIETSVGVFVLKSNEAGPDGMFRAEADGLAALRGSGTSLVVPRVVAVNDHSPAFLLLEYLRPGPPVSNFDEALGRGLAELHHHSAPQFGFTGDNFCGLTPQPNPWTHRWVDFYGSARLGHQARLASLQGRLSAGDLRAIDRLLVRLPGLIDEPLNGPSLIHGDLWSGNLHRDPSGRPALIDPAVHFAHREAELGMMALFGGFSIRVFDAYHEVFPLEPGWRDRTGIYQLYHLLNHLNLFGAAYHGQVMDVVQQFV